MRSVLSQKTALYIIVVGAFLYLIIHTYKILTTEYCGKWVIGNRQ